MTICKDPDCKKTASFNNEGQKPLYCGTHKLKGMININVYSKCEHGRQKSRCRDCGGSSICEHGKVKDRCRECGGSGICEHGKRKNSCRDCGGSCICEHGKVKDRCSDCGGSAFC